MGAKVGIGYVIKDDKSNEEESQDDGEGSEDQTKLLSSIPFANNDVRNEDEGRQNSEYEPAYLREVIDIG